MISAIDYRARCRGTDFKYLQSLRDMYVQYNEDVTVRFGRQDFEKNGMGCLLGTPKDTFSPCPSFHHDRHTPHNMESIQDILHFLRYMGHLEARASGDDRCSRSLGLLPVIFARQLLPPDGRRCSVEPPRQRSMYSHGEGTIKTWG